MATHVVILHQDGMTMSGRSITPQVRGRVSRAWPRTRGAWHLAFEPTAGAAVMVGWPFVSPLVVQGPRSGCTRGVRAPGRAGCAGHPCRDRAGWRVVATV